MTHNLLEYSLSIIKVRSHSIEINYLLDFCTIFQWQHSFHYTSSSKFLSMVCVHCFSTMLFFWLLLVDEKLVSQRRVWVCSSVRVRYCDLLEIDHEDVVTERWETSHGHRCHQTVSFLCYRHYKERIAFEGHHVNK